MFRESDPLRTWATLLNQYVVTSIETVTASYTADAGDSTILCNCSAGAITVTLPPASTVEAMTLCIKKTDGSVNAATIDAAGTETIDGALTVTLAAQWDGRVLQSNGSNWVVLASI